MTRRGFTLIEMMLAMVVGMLVLTTALAVMLTVSRTDRNLEQRAIEQHEVAISRVAINKALTNLRPAPNNIVREQLTIRNNATDEEIKAFLATPYADPIEGTPYRFKLDNSVGTARLELVSDRLPAGLKIPYQTNEATPSQTGAEITFDDLDGYRGAFELELAQDKEAYLLWWIPLPPLDLPEGAYFDESTLPEPTLLCSHVKSLRWTAFIKSGKIERVRAIESQQFPAFVELELTTTGGLYKSWMFELGWTPGPEIGVNVESQDDDSGDNDQLGGGS
jgi:prepilin-type N-terminal cleavage/methylation domain-containing protein